MSALETRAEIIKLARVLALDSKELEFLAVVPAPELRHLRETTHEYLFSRGRQAFQRLAATTRLLPSKLTAFIGQKIFGPVFVARIAGEMPADRAVEIAQKMEIGFLADVCLQLDPRRVGEIIHRMPVDNIREVALELVRRREYITMGLFVGYLADAAIEAVMPAITEEEDLLHVGLFVEAKEQIPKLTRMLPDVRLRRFIKLAADPVKDHWAEALSLMAYADRDMMQKLGDMMAEEDEATLALLLRRSHEQGLWGSVLPVIAHMSPDRQTRLVHLPALADPEVLKALFAVAEQEGLWRLLLPLVARMTEAQLAAAADPEALLRLFRAAEQARLLPRLLELFSELTPLEREQIAGIAVALPPELQERFVEEVDRAQLWEPLFRVAAAIPPAARATLVGTVQRIAARRPQLVEQLSALAEVHGLQDLLAAARAA